jgi:hypothetical protein
VPTTIATIGSPYWPTPIAASATTSTAATMASTASANRKTRRRDWRREISWRSKKFRS